MNKSLIALVALIATAQAAATKVEADAFPTNPELVQSVMKN